MCHDPPPNSDARYPAIEDPYRYGFRDEPVLRPDGSYATLRIILTPEDQLHPHEGDHFAHDSVHDQLRSYLSCVFRCRLENDPSALVSSNQGILWDVPDLKHHAPDVAVIFGARPQKRNWIMFDAAAEGTRPRLIVELVTPLFRDNDVVHKFRQYHQAQVAIYVICDRLEEEGPWIIRGYSWTPQCYEPMPLDEQGRLWLSDLQVWLKSDGLRLRCVDGSTGEEIGDYVEISKRLAALKLPFIQDRQRADAAEARADEISLRLAALKQQIIQDQQRADAAKARADQYKAEADAAEARRREAEAKLAKLSQLPPP